MTTLVKRAAAVIALVAVITVGVSLVNRGMDRLGHGSGGTPPTRGASANDSSSCKRSKKVIVVRFSMAKWPNIADHIHDERNHYVHTFHWAPSLSDEHRDEWHKSQGDEFPPKKGYDRDEYPPAAAREGGADTNLRYVPSSENRSSGSYMGTQMHPYCTGQRFTMVPSP